MNKIILTKGYETTVDDVDFELLNKHKWCYHNGYAVRRMPKEASRLIYMHRVIAKTKEDEQTDHINMDRLDNRRNNLRVVNKSENMMNRGKQLNNSSGFKGVSLDKRKTLKKWRANIQVGGKPISLGYFVSPYQASDAYNEAAIKYHREFARINNLKNYGNTK